ncbi:MAG: sulfotransferase family 2 domain-containing protein [Bacteroidetes bacterium]|nr:sulfotransferase family 2 domain-containing protein [Bacteroidota bacterium]
MICHDYKCIFVHIPKAAGQSVEHYFLQKVGLDWDSRSPLLLRKNDQPKAGPPTLAHMRAADYVKYHYLSQELFDTYYKFSFVRNPWSRAVSMYKFLGYHTFMSFENFVLYQLPKLMKSKSWFVAPQYDMLYDNDILQVDFVGKFENIDVDFAQVCTHFGFSDKILPHVNKSKSDKFKGLKQLIKNPALLTKLSLTKFKKDYKAYYQSKTTDMINKIYQKDIEVFEYMF